MSLTEPQKVLLAQCEVPELHRKLLQDWLTVGKDGKPASSLDFLQLLSDLLQTAEKHLQAKRIELSRKIKESGFLVSPSEDSPEILALEETIKNSWQTAIALWRAVDQVISDPKAYDIQLTSDHIRYAIVTKNLPVLEMLKWAQPTYFEIGNPSLFVRRMQWILGGVFGALLGSVAGFLGGLKEGLQQPSWQKILFPFYGLIGFFVGGGSAAVRGARLGYRTADFDLTLKLIWKMGLQDPFHAPMGSKKQQDIALMIEETLFDVAFK